MSKFIHCLEKDENPSRRDEGDIDDGKRTKQRTTVAKAPDGKLFQFPLSKGGEVVREQFSYSKRALQIGLRGLDLN